MALPQHIVVRHQLQTLKGRILDVPGVAGGIWQYDPEGKLLAKGFSLKIIGLKMSQPNEGAAPMEVATVQVTRATAEGARQTYKITQPVKRLMENFADVIREGVGDD